MTNNSQLQASTGAQDRERRRRASYFQFPICALAYGNSHEERVRNIIAYSTVRTGEIHWSRLTDIEKANFLSRVEGWRRFNPKNERHCAALCGTFVVGHEADSPRALMAGHDAFARFYEKFEASWGKDAQVRLRKKILLEARNPFEGSLTIKDFNVLTAIYSAIGAKSGPVWIAPGAIRTRALGYRSKKVMHAAIGSRTDGQQPMSDDEINGLVQSLHERKFFALVQTEGRMYFSHRMSHVKLKNAVDRLLRPKSAGAGLGFRMRSPTQNDTATVPQIDAG